MLHWQADVHNIIRQVLGGGGPVPRLALGAQGAPMRTPRETQRSAATDPFFSARSGGQTARSAFAASAYSFRSMGVRHGPRADLWNSRHKVYRLMACPDACRQKGDTGTPMHPPVCTAETPA